MRRMHETRIWVWSWGSFSFLKCSSPKEYFSRSGCLHESYMSFFQMDLWKTSETQRFLFWPTIRNSMTEPVPQNPSCVINCLLYSFSLSNVSLDWTQKPNQIVSFKPNWILTIWGVSLLLNELRLDTSGNVTSTETTSAPSTSASCTNQGCTLSMGNLRPSTTYTLFLGLDMGSSDFLLALVIVEITENWSGL